jgi:hypothetical protein
VLSRVSLKRIVLIADFAVVVAGLVCVGLTTVIPRFAATDMDRWELVKQHAYLGCLVFFVAFAAAVVLTAITCCYGPKYRLWAGLMVPIWTLLIIAMAVGFLMIIPLDIRTRQRIAFSEKAALDHKKLAAECLTLRRSGISDNVPQSAWQPRLRICILAT